MRKIIFLSEGGELTLPSLRFAVLLARNYNAYLEGLFVKDLSYIYLSSNPGLDPQPYEFAYDYVAELTEEIDTRLKSGVNRFLETAIKSGIRPTVRITGSDSSDELRMTTSFADILITPSEIYFGESSIPGARQFAEEIITSAQCPVLMISGAMEFPLSNVKLVYKSPDSLAAIKAFLSIFARDIKDTIEVITISSNNSNEAEVTLLKEYLSLYPIEFTFSENKLAMDETVRKISAEKGATIVFSVSDPGPVKKLFGYDLVREIISIPGLSFFTCSV